MGLFDEIRRALEEAMTEQQTTAMPGRSVPRQVPPKPVEKTPPKRDPPRPVAAPVKHIPSAAGTVSVREPSKRVELHKALAERSGLRQAMLMKDILDRPRSLNPWRGR